MYLWEIVKFLFFVIGYFVLSVVVGGRVGVCFVLYLIYLLCGFTRVFIIVLGVSFSIALGVFAGEAGVGFFCVLG